MVTPAMLRDLTLIVMLIVTAMLVGILAAATTASSAAAQTAPVQTGLRQACTADVHALCAGILPGGGRIKHCMIEKFDQLSDGCKNAMKEMRTQSTGK